MDDGLIIAATDFSAAAQNGVTEAKRLADQRGAKLLIVNVVPPIIAPTPLIDDAQLGQVSVDLRREMTAASQKELSLLRKTLGDGPNIDIRVLDGEPSRELLDLCRQTNASLLVLGSQGTGAFNEFVFGSVARRMVRRAPCSVLVVRPQ